jgi:NitT/TauT family transport system substrate-binding protein
MRAKFVPLVLSAAVFASCSGDSPRIGSPDSTAPTETTEFSAPAMDISPDEPMPDARCAANQAAGTIVYLSGNGYAASASIVDVLLAEERGYYDDMCLDVEIRPSFTSDNYSLVLVNDAQFASAGSFSELVDFAAENIPDYIVLAVEGRTGIDALITKQGVVDDLDDLRGATLGVKGVLTPSVRALLSAAGLVEGDDFDVLELDGQSAAAHLQQPEVVGFTGYKNDEPFQLDEADLDYDMIDPSDEGIPGSFGVLYTNRQFSEQHPTAVQDFMRATMKGLADAIASPVAAARLAVRLSETGNPEQVLHLPTERYRWRVEADLVAAGVTARLPLGVPDHGLLQRELEVYAAAGLFDGVVPVTDTLIEQSLVRDLYTAAGELIWPGA